MFRKSDSPMKKAVTRSTAPPQSKRPVFFHHLAKMMEEMDVDTLMDTRDIFIFLIMFLALLRQNEMVKLKVDHMWIATNKGGLRVLCI